MRNSTRKKKRFAQLDYNSAKYLYDSPLYPLEIICYHCQQAAEKAVKALIVHFGSQGGMPKVHDIAFLLNQLKHIVNNAKGIVIDDGLMDAADGLSNMVLLPGTRVRSTLMTLLHQKRFKMLL